MMGEMVEAPQGNPASPQFARRTPQDTYPPLVLGEGEMEASDMAIPPLMTDPAMDLDPSRDREEWEQMVEASQAAEPTAWADWTTTNPPGQWVVSTMNDPTPCVFDQVHDRDEGGIDDPAPLMIEEGSNTTPVPVNTPHGSRGYHGVEPHEGGIHHFISSPVIGGASHFGANVRGVKIVSWHLPWFRGHWRRNLHKTLPRALVPGKARGGGKRAR